MSEKKRKSSKDDYDEDRKERKEEKKARKKAEKVFLSLLSVQSLCFSHTIIRYLFILCIIGSENVRIYR